MPKKKMSLSEMAEHHAMFTPALLGFQTGEFGKSKKCDSNFIDENTGCGFHYPFALYSAGTHGQLKRRDGWLSKRNKKQSFVLTDNGGFQIISGRHFTFKNIKKLNEQRRDVLEWQIFAGNIGTIIDIPLKAITEKKKGEKEKDAQPRFNSFYDCLSHTVQNIEHFIQLGLNDHPFLNILHGRSAEEQDVWFETLKVFPLQGWAFGGQTTTDVYLATRAMLILKHNGEWKKSHFHFFGAGTRLCGVLYSAFKHHINLVNPDARVTFDTRSPAQQATFYKAAGEITGAPFGTGKQPFHSLPRNDPKPKKQKKRKSVVAQQEDTRSTEVDWDYELEMNEAMLADYDLTQEGQIDLSVDFLDTRSPVLDNQKLNDILSRPLTGNSGWENRSYSLVSAHNTYMHVETIIGANTFYNLAKIDPKHSKELDDVNVLDLVAAVDEILNQKSLKKGLQRLASHKSYFDGVKIKKGS